MELTGERHKSLDLNNSLTAKPVTFNDHLEFEPTDKANQLESITPQTKSSGVDQSFFVQTNDLVFDC